MVTNPVDIMPRLFAEVSGCNRVRNIGPSTDTARCRLILARMAGVPTHAVEGHVIGEHGDRAVICASSPTIHGRPARIHVQRVREELVARPGRIAAGIGRVRSGPAGATVAALARVLGRTDGVIELSAPHEGGYLGMPLRFTAGRPTVCLPPLDSTESRDLAAAQTKPATAYTHLRITLEERS
ncbi:hypothetical protein [uncultured Streptomyces sp.]|uniref:hypothetical protein n=1 Tax=uncultured Streptomyces sp. TaxID=174707 RepID=UPI002627D4F4|nr:hypothetical protein [uncultured Streptomyces sp.]